MDLGQLLNVKLPYKLVLGKKCWTYTTDEHHYDVLLPKLELNRSNGYLEVLEWSLFESNIGPNISVIELKGTISSELALHLVLRCSTDNAIVRFKYKLVGNGHITNTRIEYVNISGPNKHVNEVQFSSYQESVHSYVLTENSFDEIDLEEGTTLMGPLVVVNNSYVLAYEHGSQVPDAFLEFTTTKSSMSLQSVKGNVLLGQKLPFETIWFNFGATKSDISVEYRQFVLKYMSNCNESREPNIYYNTWNFQERDLHWNRSDVLQRMTTDHVLAEIDVAHKMGIDVYVLDVGWFESPGDWNPSPKRFPDGLKQVQKRLEGYNMKFGLWVEPKTVSTNSKMMKDHESCVMSWKGEKSKPELVYGTDLCQQMCIVSDYHVGFANKLIELCQNYNLSYLKWDAITQYGCDDPNHLHGDSSNTSIERSDYYSFQMGLYMIRIVELLHKKCPGIIVDFDITEAARFVGLGFLSVGKFFLINNGPYDVNFDIPYPPRFNEKDTTERNGNVTFYIGPARTWMCRTCLTFDKWLPTTLFLTHYYPDDVLPPNPHDLKNLDRYIGKTGHEIDIKLDIGANTQKINIGSLILGQNGIWGDLLEVTNTGVLRLNKYLTMYKNVKNDITNAQLISRGGPVSGNPEIYEKINPATGKGVVVIFSSTFGKPLSTKLYGNYSYLTRNRVDDSYWCDNDGIEVKVVNGRAKIDVTFYDIDAKMIFFGV